MRFTRGPKPRTYIGGFHHLRRDFTHPHLWVGLWQQQRTQRCEREKPADAALASGGGDARGACDAGAAPARLARAVPAGPTVPPAPSGPRPLTRAARTAALTVMVCCVPGRVRYIVYSECAAVMTSAPFLYCENDYLMRSHSFYT